MTNYINAFENRDIRLIGQVGGGFGYRNPRNQFRGPRRDFYVKETSGMPLQQLQSEEKDPVYNIAIQNPLAQPGGGKAPMQSHRYDLGDLYGAQTNADMVPNIPTTSDKYCNPGAYSSYQTSPEQIQQQYYAAGKRANGTGTYVANSAFGDEHTILNRRGDSASRRNGRYDVKDAQTFFNQNNTVVYTGTALACCSTPVGSKRAIGSVYSGYTADMSTPPKTIVSSTDSTLFKPE
jgi:hypothetical protein